MPALLSQRLQLLIAILALLLIQHAKGHTTLQPAEGHMQGVRRPALPDYLQAKQAMALHEAGRALVATVLRKAQLDQGLPPRLERVERVTVVARGRSDAHAARWPAQVQLQILPGWCTLLIGHWQSHAPCLGAAYGLMLVHASNIHTACTMHQSHAC